MLTDGRLQANIHKNDLVDPTLDSIDTDDFFEKGQYTHPAFQQLRESPAATLKISLRVLPIGSPSLLIHQTLQISGMLKISSAEYRGNSTSILFMAR